MRLFAFRRSSSVWKSCCSHLVLDKKRLEQQILLGLEELLLQSLLIEDEMRNAHLHLAEPGIVRVAEPEIVCEGVRRRGRGWAWWP